MRLHLLLVLALSISGCSSPPADTPTLPDPALGKLRSLAYLPTYGEPADPVLQNTLAKRWAATWNEVHKGTLWIGPPEVLSRHFSEDMFTEWSKYEKRFMQSGRFSSELVQKICAAVKTDAVVQPVIYSAAGGERGNLLRFVTPFAGQATKSTANLSLTVYSCSTGNQVWEAAETVEWSGYTRTQMLEYTQDRLARVLLW